jgi:hypothetical protein
MEAYGLPFVRIDGSSDELVNVSLLSRLMHSFPEARPSLLVLDEYHMLSESHKDQLFKWLCAQQRLEWLRVILIANRIFDADAKRVGELKASTSNMRIHVESLSCRADVHTITNEVLGVAARDNDDHLLFMRQWHCCTRMIFGEDMLSIRNVEQLFNIKKESGERIDTEALVKMLDDKMPRLGLHTCELFTHAFVDTRERSHASSADRFKAASSAMHLLMAAAWLDVLQDSDVKDDRAADRKSLCSFPEFVTRNTAAQFHRFHPSVRLAAWVAYLISAVKQDYEGLDEAELDKLTQITCMDQVSDTAQRVACMMTHRSRSFSVFSSASTVFLAFWMIPHLARYWNVLPRHVWATTLIWIGFARAWCAVWRSRGIPLQRNGLARRSRTRTPSRICCPHARTSKLA